MYFRYEFISLNASSTEKRIPGKLCSHTLPGTIYSNWGDSMKVYLYYIRLNFLSFLIVCVFIVRNKAPMIAMEDISDHTGRPSRLKQAPQPAV